MTGKDIDFLERVLDEGIGRSVRVASDCHEINGTLCDPSRGCELCQSRRLIDELRVLVQQGGGNTPT